MGRGQSRETGPFGLRQGGLFSHEYASFSIGGGQSSGQTAGLLAYSCCFPCCFGMRAVHKLTSTPRRSPLNFIPLMWSMASLASLWSSNSMKPKLPLSAKRSKRQAKWSRWSAKRSRDGKRKRSRWQAKPSNKRETMD